MEEAWELAALMNTPTVFISWSKPKAKKVAVLLKGFIERVLPGVSAFVSEHDISKGSRGMDAIAHNLENAFFGIVCLTRENANSPWINFEAGALSKHVSIDRVSPLLLDLGITDLGPSPLAQFQATFTEKSDFRRLLTSIAEQSGLQHALTNLDVYIDNFWLEFDEKLRVAVSMGSIVSRPEEVSKTETQLNELARLLNAISFKINSPEKLLPKEYLNSALVPMPFPNSSYVQGADLEALTKRLEELSNLSWNLSSTVEDVIAQAESLIDRIQQDDVPEHLQIEIESDLNSIIVDLSVSQNKIERAL